MSGLYTGYIGLRDVIEGIFGISGCGETAESPLQHNCHSV